MARNFKSWLAAYASYTSDSESPAEFHLWSGVWTISAALRRRVWIDMRKFQWTPNFYIVLVGPAGIVTKSTSIRIGMRLLEKVGGIKFGPSSVTWQKLTDNLANAVEHMKYHDAAGKEVFIPMSCLSIPVSELGTFLKVDDTAFMDVMTDLWDGQLTTWSHGTLTSSNIEIKNPWLNIIACTTPTWLKGHFPEALIGGGLTSRIVFVYGEKKAKLVPYPDEMKTTPEYLEHEQKLIDDLKEISLMSGEYELTSEARTWGHDWYAKHWSTRPDHLASDRYGGYIARKQTHLHKIAIVLAASESNKLIIEKDHLENAEQLLQSVEPHMLKVFESIGASLESKNLEKMLPFLRSAGFLTVDELFIRVRNIMSQKDFEEALKAGIRGKAIKVAIQGLQKGLAPT